MNITDAMILGIIQGVFEWLPVSSEGMTSIYLLARDYTLQEAISISIWLHTGTLLVAAIYFRKDLKAILKSLPSYLKKRPTPATSIITFLIISTACTGIVGLLILIYSLDKLNFSGAHATAFIGILLVITGILQKNMRNNQKEKKLTVADGIIVGIMQGFSAMPGLSRSGLTTAGLIFRKHNAEESLRLSFLMSIPAVFAAEAGLGLMDKIVVDANSLVAIAISFVTGYVTIGALIKFAQKVRFWKFCVLLGILSIVPYILTL
ncbi:MAG: UDP-diphosphatase [Candidatus Nanohalarchaeota archaeon]|nr:MAG: UDP-diphosphatase [Candidatus Nanohaloarchaeota archaeon]